MNKLTIFTDGAARGNPGPGGWGAIIVRDDFVTELGGREDFTTNNRMEMTAVVSALESLPDAHEMRIVSDSAYVINGATRWIFGWRKNNWKRVDSKTKKEQELLNADLWQKIYDLTSHRVIDWRLVKGHAGHPANERCDEIATSFADKKIHDLFAGSLSDYKINIFAEISAADLENKKIKSKSRAYSYVSMVDGEIKIHKTWDECKDRVNGKSGARFKKSVSPEDEEKIIEGFKFH